MGTCSNTWKWGVAVATVLLAVHACLLGIRATTTFPTKNEVAHLPAGLSHWQGTFALYKVNPPLWRMLAVLPVLSWSPDTSGLPLPTRPGMRSEWKAAKQFAAQNSAVYWEMMQRARLAGIAWSVLCGILIYHWAQALYGPLAALLGLSLWCFDPNVLGHAPLLTPDLPATLAIFGTTFLFWRLSREPGWENALLFGLVLGLAQLTKFTALVLYVILPALWLAHRFLGRQSSLPLLPAVGRGLLIGAVSLLVINIGYNFDSSFERLKHFRFASKLLRGTDENNRFERSWLAELPLPLPAEYIRGVDVQRLDFEKGMKSFLNGEIRDGGWWYYYAYGFLYKCPLGTIILVGWAAALTLPRIAAGLWQSLFPPRDSSSRESNAPGIVNELFLWLPALLLFVFISSQSGFSRHFRYVLPIFPFLFVAVCRVAVCWGRCVHYGKLRLIARALSVMLVLWSVSSSLAVFPHSISYFNEVAGGPDNGHKHLIDSNIDWGQDMWLLKDWIESHPQARPFFVAYHNFIDYQAITGMDFPEPPRDPPATGNAQVLDDYGPHPGYFAVDVYSLFLGKYTYFRRLTPIAKAGYSIFIFRLTLEEANTVRGDLGLPPILGPATRSKAGVEDSPGANP